LKIGFDEGYTNGQKYSKCFHTMSETQLSNLGMHNALTNEKVGSGEQENCHMKESIYL
jgi:hypothetical protein